MTGIKTFDYSIDVLRPLQWKENAAEKIHALLQNKQTWLDQNHTQFWQNFETDIFDLRTANNFGLAVWSIILDFPVFLNPGSTSFTNNWGFGNFRRNFNNANFNSSSTASTEDQALSTEQLRLALRLWFYRLHMDGSVTQTNAILKDLFGHLGPAYVQDNLDMTITFKFDFALPASFLTVVEQDAIMPIAPGVNANVVYSPPHTNNGSFSAFGNYGGNSIRGIHAYSTLDQIDAIDQNTERLYTSTGGNDFTFVSVDPSNPFSLAVNEVTGDKWITDLSTNLVYKQSLGVGPWVATGGYLGGNSANNVNAIAVNGVNGDVWAVSKDTDLVYKLVGGIGAWIEVGSFSGTQPNSIAVNMTSGDIWVVDSSGGGAWLLSEGTGTFSQFGSFPGNSGLVAVDNSNSDVWVMRQDASDRRLYLLSESQGTFSAVGTYPGNGPIDISVDSSNGDIFVSNTFGFTAIVYKSPGVSTIVTGIWGETLWNVNSINGHSWNGAGDELTFTNAGGNATGNNIQVISAATTQGHVAENVEIDIVTSATGGFGDELTVTIETSTGETTQVLLYPDGTGTAQGGGLFLYTLVFTQAGFTGDFDQVTFFQNNTQTTFVVNDVRFA